MKNNKIWMDGQCMKKDNDDTYIVIKLSDNNN